MLRASGSVERTVKGWVLGFLVSWVILQLPEMSRVKAASVCRGATRKVTAHLPGWDDSYIFI